MMDELDYLRGFLNNDEAYVTDATLRFMAKEMDMSVIDNTDDDDGQG